MAGMEASRKEMFLRGEKDYLRYLPERRFVMKEQKLMTVGRNSYVSLFKHYYGVPKEYVERNVTMLYDADSVEIYCGMSLVAIHGRCDIPYTYSWKKEHNLPGHTGTGEKYGLDRLIAACAYADQKLRYGYQDLREVLELGEDADIFPEDGRRVPNETSSTPLAHKNIRRSGYYSKDSHEQ